MPEDNSTDRIWSLGWDADLWLLMEASFSQGITFQSHFYLNGRDPLALALSHTLFTAVSGGPSLHSPVFTRGWGASTSVCLQSVSCHRAVNWEKYLRNFPRDNTGGDWRACSRDLPPSCCFIHMLQSFSCEKPSRAFGILLLLRSSCSPQLPVKWYFSSSPAWSSTWTQVCPWAF